MKILIRFFMQLIATAAYLLLPVSCSQSSGCTVNKKTGPSANAGDFSFRGLSEKEKKYYQPLIEDFYDSMLLRSGFNGSILVAKNGEILFEDYHGIYDFSKGTPITDSTPFHLASISKTFTGMTVLKLAEQKRLSLDDTLQKFFPALPYKGITVKMLLNHRSGLPNYFYFMDSVWDKHKKATNEDVLNFMIEHQPKADALPDRIYHYCNTNFMLLALIVEHITHQPFPRYMKDSVFTPLGLKNTFVFSIADTLNYVPTYSVTKPFPMEHLDCTYGDKNIYSTVRDLLQWDKALYQHTFISRQSEELAFTPYSNERKSMHNYGLGWHLFFHNGDSIIYHNGYWHGSNTVFTRLVQDTATIIVLGNKINRNIYSAKQMSTIFNGRIDTASLEE